MTFAEFYQEVLSSVFPDKDSPRLTKRHRNSVCDALTRVQRYAKCYRNNHKNIIRQDDTTFVGGVSVFDRVQGQPWEVRIERLDAPSDFVLAQPYTFAQMRALMETKGSCEYPVQCAPYGYDYGDYYIPGECAPESACVPNNYAVAMDDDSMFLYPAVHICTQVVVSWKGIKRMWGDLDLIPWLDEDGYIDRDVMQAVEYFLHHETMLKDDCDPEKASVYLGLHMAKIAELNSICARRNEVVGPPILFPWASSSRRECILSEEGGSVTPSPEVATPIFSPGGGNQTVGPLVTIHTITPGATIRWTNDGTLPNQNSPIYLEPIRVSTNSTLRAIAYKSGFRDSQPGYATYTILTQKVADPSISPGSGTYSGNQTISITCPTSGAFIWYTDDDTIPVPSLPSKQYIGPFVLTSSKRITAIAVKAGMTNSGTPFVDYVIIPAKVANPTFSPTPSLNYFDDILVTITTSTPGAVVHYTIDGNQPIPGNANTFAFQSPIPIALFQSRNFIAKAFKTGSQPSDPVEGRYAVVLGPPVFTKDPDTTQRYQWSWELVPPETGDRAVVKWYLTFPFPTTGKFAGSEIWYVTGSDTDEDPHREQPPSSLWNPLNDPNYFTTEESSRQVKAITWWQGHESTVTFDVVNIVLPVFFGASTLATLNPNQVRALSSNLNFNRSSMVGAFVYTAPIGVYEITVPANGYIYIAWDENYSAPFPASGFRIGDIAVPMVAGGVYDQVDNEWPYQRLDMESMTPTGSGPGGANFKVFRSANTYPAGKVMLTVALDAGTVPNTKTVYWGHSSSTILDEAGVKALGNSAQEPDPYRLYSFSASAGINDYFFWWWPDSFGPPAPSLGFNLDGFAVLMAGAAQGFNTGQQNNWYYKALTVDGVPGKEWRTFNKLGSGEEVPISVV